MGWNALGRVLINGARDLVGEFKAAPCMCFVLLPFRVTLHARKNAMKSFCCKFGTLIMGIKGVYARWHLQS